MVVADLHVHTTNSDGQLTLPELPAAAERAGVETVAVTDHDRLHPELSRPVTSREGLTIVHGIELRVETATQRVDLLGYGAERTEELTGLIDRLQTDRIDRARRIVERVEDRLGVELAVEYEPGVGRPHIARAIADSPAPYDYREAFDELIGDDSPCYVPREIPSVSAGRKRLADACAVVGLAHPLRYDDPASALELTADLDAVERHYPYDRSVDPAPVERAIERHDLLATGGSDAHDERLGRAGLTAEQFGPIRARL